MACIRSSIRLHALGGLTDSENMNCRQRVPFETAHLGQRPGKVVRHEATHLGDLDVVVIEFVEQVAGELRRPPRWPLRSRLASAVRIWRKRRLDPI